MREDCERARTPRGGRWRLTVAARRATVVHLGRRPDQLLATLRGVPDDPLDVGRTMARAYLSGDAPALGEQTVGELTGTRLAADWLDEVPAGLPAKAEIDRQIRLATLLAPLRVILDAPVRGREAELHLLDDHADRPARGDGGFRPLAISGPGGVGKSTLLAAFLLRRSGRGRGEGAAPFAYITFDRTDLVPQRPLTVLAEVLRQVSLEFPASTERCARVAGELEATQDKISAAERDARGFRGTVDMWRRWQRDVDRLVGQFAEVTASVTGGAIVCVLDTFERAQRQGPAPVARLWDLLAQVTTVLPGLRVVVAGRGRIPHHDVSRLELTGLGDEAARAVLLDRLGDRAVPASLVELVVRRSRGNPLTLRLAAELMDRQADTLASQAGKRAFLQAFDEVEVQGVLYQRVLDHVDDAEAQALALPGLVLRRITVELVRDVLARSAGLGRISTGEAQRLYEILHSESSLLLEHEHALVHREDVRAQVLPILKRKAPALVASVHRRAVHYYQAQTSAQNRTEELYHRLALAQGRRTLESRWNDEAGASLYSTLEQEDLEPAVHVWLAGKLGLSVNADLLRQVDDAAWVAPAARTARDLLDAGMPGAALEILQQRGPRPLDPTVTALLAEALARTGEARQAEELVEDATSRATERGDAATVAQLSAFAAQLAEDHGDFVRALELLTEARSRARQVGDDVQETALGAGMLRMLRRLGRATDAGTVELRAGVTQLARRLTHKQRSVSPGLVRDLAAEIGTDAPEFVIEASNTVGVDVTSVTALQNLSSHHKGDLAYRIRDILDTDEATEVLPAQDSGPEVVELTSHAQGVAIGNYLSATSDPSSNSAMSEYFQLEADAPSFDTGFASDVTSEGSPEP